MKRFLRTVSAPASALVLILVFWTLIVRIFEIPVYLLPTPIKIAQFIVAHPVSLGIDLWTTMTESMLGFLIGNGLGFCFAILFAYSRTAERALYPYAIALKTTPIIAIAPILVLWFGPGIVSKIVASAAICFFPILVNASRGLRDIDSAALDLFHSLDASETQVFVKLRLPSALPYVFSAMRISTSLSIIGAIVGEFLGASHGVGYAIVVAYTHLEMDVVFASVAMSAIGGVSFFALIVLLERTVMPWTRAQ
jgi:NitT/TauT family transport system permease protein